VKLRSPRILAVGAEKSRSRLVFAGRGPLGTVSSTIAAHAGAKAQPPRGEHPAPCCKGKTLQNHSPNNMIRWSPATKNGPKAPSVLCTKPASVAKQADSLGDLAFELNALFTSALSSKARRSSL